MLTFNVFANERILHDGLLIGAQNSFELDNVVVLVGAAI